MSLLLAGPGDKVILRSPSDPEFLSYLRVLGLAQGEILSVDAPDAVTPISKLVLESPALCSTLRDISRRQYCLLPYGVTRLEDEISRATSLPIAGGPAQICGAVNSKIFSRRLSRELGLKTVAGFECESLEELEDSYLKMAAQVPDSAKLVLKEAMGVSGKGMVTLESRARFDQMLGMLKRTQKPESRFRFVLEEWINKTRDISYQIFVLRSGEVRLLSLKEAVTSKGVHQGHRVPAQLTDDQFSIYHAAAQAVGRRLFEAGFVGLAGIDSIIDQHGEIYPVLEINARFTMSTYQFALENMIGRQAKMVVKFYPLFLKEPVSFSQLTRSWERNLYGMNGTTEGVGLLCFGAVNCNTSANQTAPARGRLYVFITAATFERIDELDNKIETQLARAGWLSNKAH
jgi:D-alanine-D-alanine ligase-like ATP-grasp enzyme